MSTDWTEINDADPESVPQEMCHVLVATSFGGVHQTFFSPDLKFFTARDKYWPSRKCYGKYSRHFELCGKGYKITHWAPIPKHPNA